MFVDAGVVVDMSSLLSKNLADVFMMWQLVVFVVGLVLNERRKLMLTSVVFGLISVAFRLIWLWEMYN